MARILRTVVLASIAVGALLGIITLLGADIGETGGKVIGTSFCVTGAALVSMPSAAAWEDHRLGQLAIVGMVSAVVGFAWLAVGIWAEFDYEPLWKIPVSLLIVAVAIAVMSLLDVANLAEGQQWVLTAARLATGAVALMLIFGIWAEEDADGYWRAFGVAAVLMAAFLAAVPILHRSGRVGGDAVEFCPLCGAAHHAAAGDETQCPACMQRYRVAL